MLGRPGRDTEAGHDLIEAILFQSGRPLLLTPERLTHPLLATIVVAWKDTPEAAHAVAAATPLIEQAERVMVCKTDEDVHDDDPERDSSCARLVRTLLRHNRHVTARHVASDGREPVDTLIDAIADEASLLVTGAYGHGRLREAVFGGFTRRVSSDGNLPVLLAH